MVHSAHCSVRTSSGSPIPGLALPVVSAVVVWTNVGYVSLFFLAGILAIPEDIQNAARTDGASAWQRFRRITLPMLRPTLFFVLVTGIISAAQVFDTVYALTAGGPQGRTDLVAHRIYAEAFGSAAAGRAAVMAVVLLRCCWSARRSSSICTSGGGSAMTST